MPRTAPVTNQMWERFWNAPTPQAQDRALDELARRYLYLVTATIPRVIGFKVDWEDCEDYIACGNIKLLDAIRRFDKSRGVKFASFAITLIRGALLQHKRDSSPKTRREYERFKQLEQATEAFQAKHLHRPTDDELARFADISVQELMRWRILDCEKAPPVSLEQSLLLDGFHPDDDLTLEDLVGDGSENPHALLESREKSANLQWAFQQLPHRSQKILTLYYNQDISFRKIAHIVGISESRVWQLHNRALKRLRDLLTHPPQSAELILKKGGDRMITHPQAPEIVTLSLGEFQIALPVWLHYACTGFNIAREELADKYGVPKSMVNATIPGMIAKNVVTMLGQRNGLLQPGTAAKVQLRCLRGNATVCQRLEHMVPGLKIADSAVYDLEELCSNGRGTGRAVATFPIHPAVPASDSVRSGLVVEIAKRRERLTAIAQESIVLQDEIGILEQALAVL